jgi:hypothetical protein
MYTYHHATREVEVIEAYHQAYGFSEDGFCIFIVFKTFLDTLMLIIILSILAFFMKLLALINITFHMLYSKSFFVTMFCDAIP